MNKYFAKLTCIDLNVLPNNEFCTMQILVIAATEMEIGIFMKDAVNTDILITGVGTPSTIYQLTKKLFSKKYDLVIQGGIAGAFSTVSYPLGSVVLVAQDVFADVGIEENKGFHTIFEMGFADANAAPYKNGWLVNESLLLQQFSLQKVKGITVNKISDDVFQTELFSHKYLPDIESMEGAALHFVCMQEGVPFLQLRSISNQVGERDKTKWKMKEAITNLNERLKLIVGNLENK